ncbi:MAG: hypothetical protein B6245_18350, partial [Desulfobacteraceae bacterium 4572_88]
MKKKKFYWPHFFGYIIFFIAVFFISFASESLAKKTPACLSIEWPHEKSDLSPAPELVFGKLPNGFRYVLMENHEPRDRVSLHLNVQAGSLHEKDEQRGLAHYLEHMLFNGSEHFAPGELVKYFQSIGMAFGADANAHTGYDETVYDVLLPTGDKESLEKGLLAIQDYARGALLLESEIERERGIILAEKRTRDSAGYRTHVASMNFLFSGTLLPQRMPIGTEAVIKGANHSLLKDYYDAWYRPENMILVMVGDFKTTLAESLIKSRFTALEPGVPPRTCPDLGKVRHKGTKTFYHF